MARRKASSCIVRRSSGQGAFLCPILPPASERAESLPSILGKPPARHTAFPPFITKKDTTRPARSSPSPRSAPSMLDRATTMLNRCGRVVVNGSCTYSKDINPPGLADETKSTLAEPYAGPSFANSPFPRQVPMPAANILLMREKKSGSQEAASTYANDPYPPSPSPSELPGALDKLLHRHANPISPSELPLESDKLLHRHANPISPSELPLESDELLHRQRNPTSEETTVYNIHLGDLQYSLNLEEAVYVTTEIMLPLFTLGDFSYNVLWSNKSYVQEQERESHFHYLGLNCTLSQRLVVPQTLVCDQTLSRNPLMK